MNDHETHHHHQGLKADLDAMLHQQQRRHALGWLSAVGGYAALTLTGCGGGGDSSSSTSSSSSSSTSSTSSSSTATATASNGSTCSVINEETQGPYPGDGSNSVSSSIVNALSLSGIVRSDIRTSVGSASGTASGVQLTLNMTLVNVNDSCNVLSGYAIYLWHCTQDGKYSLYASGLTSQNYLRGVQATSSSGVATFVTIFPGCYSGRMPHMHFEVYPSLAKATSYANKIKTSQLAFPVATCQSVYNNVSGYSASVANLAAISFSTDNVFSDGVTLELVSITGDNDTGYVANITVGIYV
jgi:protocatechuate 3,4-dioxygenase beta subunit